ncbi:hypothetical protein [Microvirga sp. BSC39]|jgi:hypothetical protein|uniref:hypothetical protein n=1 Tax=Microvirga sp. BSC39 TaxID=1549810 RepID=UPI0004E95F0C|nr:hypothetical protein [Microvirga sp. BSC39]KFG68666.1 hypothetical protein JH26_14395 [Microvirga sp. BSC39]
MELEKIKEAIAASTRDEELASATRYEVEAYARLWPFVFLVNDWDVWNGSKRSLNLQVVRWLESEGAPYDFFQIRTGFGLMGFKDQEAAKAFERRWSGRSQGTPASNGDWNPHPLKSTFEPVHVN